MLRLSVDEIPSYPGASHHAFGATFLPVVMMLSRFAYLMLQYFIREHCRLKTIASVYAAIQVAPGNPCSKR
jgi:hypothetical protein